MPVPITNLMRNQVAHYHCTTGGCVRLVSKADMFAAKGKRPAVCARYLGRLQAGVLNMRQPADRNLANQIGQFIDK